MRFIVTSLVAIGTFASVMAVISYFHEVEDRINCRERGGQMIRDFGCVDAEKLKEFMK